MSKPLTTLSQARVDWYLNLDNGGYCPVCSRWGKEYRRGINRTMAESVRWLCEQDPTDGWVDIPNTAPKWILRSNQLPTMKWWGLVERKAVEPPSEQQVKKKGDNKHSGLWRPTQKGRDFVFGGLAIPKYVYTYYDTVTRFGNELTTFGECHDTFSYIEVMSNGELE